MKLSEIRQILEERDIRLTRSLGQSFLHDANQLRRIVELADLEPGDRVLEVGPGVGPLTELLVPRVREVLAIEKDRRLVDVLCSRYDLKPPTGEPPIARPVGPGGRLTVMHADALRFVRNGSRDWSSWKLVSNLPYSVASPILVELALSQPGPRMMVATLQLEVVRRLVARAGDEDYGLLTLLIQLDYELGEWFRIPAACFFPQPDVDSACVRLARRHASLLSARQRGNFVQIVKASFSQRRKMMFKLLRKHWSENELRTAFASAAISPLARAESVSLAGFVSLAAALHGEGGE
jgi:16S rRNA (adenine1518-N6/adenine1519-N6)-dimethyltransferase